MTTIDGYEIDAVLSLDPSVSAQVTQHPVDSGATYSDHIISAPPRVAITGIVSDTSLRSVTDEVATSDAYALLLSIASEQRLVTISSDSFPDFTNMGLVSLSTAKSGPKDSLEFRATFQQLALFDVSAEARATVVAVPRAQKKERKGAKASKTLDPETTPTPPSRGQSWAEAVFSPFLDN